jgi:hypothetical protein
MKSKRKRRAAKLLPKNGEPVAQIVHDSEKVCRGQELAEVLAKTQLSSEEAVAWHCDLKKGRKTLRTPTKS